MSNHGPVGVGTLPDFATRVAGSGKPCTLRIRERSRWEWRSTDGGDPAQHLEDFLAADGLDVRSLTSPSLSRSVAENQSGSVCGAAILISAAGAAAMLPRGPVARPTPAPAIPDLVAVVYEHADVPDAPATTNRNVVRTHGHVPSMPLISAKESGRSPLGGTAGWQLGEWRPSWTPAQHAAAVTAVRAAIGRGDVYQVNVVGHASAPYVGDPLPALARLSELPGARYGGLLSGAGWAVGCASPETLIQVVDGRAITRPIKGTRAATKAGRRELLGSAKERAEHIMIVDLERNDLARVARTGSVRVDELFAIRRWVDLWQAESVVSADLADGIGLADLLRATCPGGSVTGAPKLAALQHIAALEPVGRGPSMGALGWIDASGNLDLGLTIRTAAADADRLHLWAGGGITWDSDPAAEVAEAAAKAAPIRRLLASS
ncbi:chorismate-binding protein [Asanoa sp. WMMD1127]|uniref:chorismate-binding protein n=1 Tax=Asanoa sp. WMMD1127 TaxID=3016107 RepID=UPI0024166DC0|nr:chorismate-binding protein [Asanoa sp. WMMD1127]MDG4826139.1 chorismate-binding protein [Asanoa sp. WMMD1127]